MQVDVRNRWPDGSVKFAVRSGISSFTSNVGTRLSLRKGASASGAEVPTITVDDIGVTEVDFGVFGKAVLVVGTQTAYTASNIGNKKWSAGRIRTVATWASYARGAFLFARIG